MFTFLNSLLSFLQPFWVPLGFLCAWGFILALAWTLVSATYSAVQRSKTMHKIPCANCQFFTNDHRLKCTIQPVIANTEQAISCPDYCPRSPMN